MRGFSRCAFRAGPVSASSLEVRSPELRRKAEKDLGTGFDVRAFHDVVLGSGSVPLNVLENNVNRWIGEQRQERTAR